MKIDAMISVLVELGFKKVSIHPALFISRYPGAHSKLSHVTNHHPERFHKVWKDGKKYILLNSDHAAAVVDGEVHDWSKGRAKRCDFIWQIVKSDERVILPIKYEVKICYINPYGKIGSVVNFANASDPKDASAIALFNFKRTSYHRNSEAWVESTKIYLGYFLSKSC